MLRRILPRTKSAFESRTQVWREVGLGSEIDAVTARRSKRGALYAVVLIAAVLFCFSQRKALFPGYGLEVRVATDRKSTRLNSSHVEISYAVFCLKKKRP